MKNPFTPEDKERFKTELMTIHVVNLSIYGMRKIKTINIYQLYLRLNKGANQTWIDYFDFSNDYAML